MKQLINITESNGSQLVDARELHLKIQSKRDFSNWITFYIKKYEFVENEDYFIDTQRSTNLLSKKDNRGGHNKIDYSLSIGMAKELAMVQDNEMGRLVRKYFIAIEKAATASLLRMPASLYTKNNIELVPYEWWLLQNGYSCSSGSARMRRLKHPDQFYKHSTTAKWYITRNLGDALIEYRTAKTKINELAPVPVANQLKIF